MPLKDLLVHVDTGKEAEATLDAAIALATVHDCHLVGLGVSPPLDIPTYAAGNLPSSVFTVLEEREAERLGKAEELFRTRIRQAGRVERSEWRLDYGLPESVVGLHARYADLALVTQSNPTLEERRFIDLPEDLVLSAGRPALIIPYIGAPNGIGKNVIVAWNASREAARAVADAMPLLEQAEKVKVVVAGAEPIGDLPGADIAVHLARHGINVGVHRAVVDDIDVGDVLLNRVTDLGADLMVMGGYGRSRLRELVLGGATRHILEHMTIPVLMSH
jgi:nucleotide-binding universal stress UspA family protein